MDLKLDPAFIPKVSLHFHLSQELFLPSFCPNPTHPLEQRWHTLDVGKALKAYLTRTEMIRKKDTLFINIAEPNKGKKTSSSVSFAIHACIALAYKAVKILVSAGIMAHSTRCTATNAAFACQASVDEVYRAAKWTSISTFIRHYKLDKCNSADAAFGRRVLQHVLPENYDAPPNN